MEGSMTNVAFPPVSYQHQAAHPAPIRHHATVSAQPVLLQPLPNTEFIVSYSNDHARIFFKISYFNYFHFQVRRNCVEVCQRRRSNISTGTQMSQWRMSIVAHVYSLCRHMSLAAYKSKLKTYLFSRSQWLMMAIRRCCSVFSWFRHCDISDFTYLHTYCTIPVAHKIL